MKKDVTNGILLIQAIARAVYARPSIIILDDVLSALDAKTETHVAEQLLGKKGIFRNLGTTVVLITHACKYKASQASGFIH